MATRFDPRSVTRNRLANGKRATLPKVYWLGVLIARNLLYQKSRMLSCRRRRKAKVRQKRSSKDDDVDEALFTWFVDARAQDLPITSAVL